MDWTVAIGVDTHQDGHVAVALDRLGAARGSVSRRGRRAGLSVAVAVGAGAWGARLRDRGHGQLRRRSGPLPGRGGRRGVRVRAAPPRGASARQERPDRRDARRARLLVSGARLPRLRGRRCARGPAAAAARAAQCGAGAAPPRSTSCRRCSSQRPSRAGPFPRPRRRPARRRRSAGSRAQPDQSAVLPDGAASPRSARPPPDRRARRSSTRELETIVATARARAARRVRRRPRLRRPTGRLERRPQPA